MKLDRPLAQLGTRLFRGSIRRFAHPVGLRDVFDGDLERLGFTVGSEVFEVGVDNLGSLFEDI